jgi:RNA polymerase sigma factor (sigma-70 family)
LITSFANTGQQTTAWDEHTCLKGCVRNDIVCQEVLYKRFYPTMMAIVKRYTSDKDEAVSILNNGFLKVFKNIASYKAIGSLEGWIRRIIIHAISDYYRYKHPTKEILHDNIPETCNSFGVQPINYDYNLLLALLEKLTPTTRTVVNLFLIDGFTHKQIAEQLVMSENTSKWHVAEGKRILQNKIIEMTK